MNAAKLGSRGITFFGREINWIKVLYLIKRFGGFVKEKGMSVTGGVWGGCLIGKLRLSCHLEI